LIGVDRTTIRHYTQAGMPHIPGEKGRENSYIVPVCIHWVAGYQAARKNGLPMMRPLELILFGYSGAFRECSFQEYRRAATGLVKKAGATTAEVDEAMGFLRGARLLPW